jgi:23S rRNA pseudouridine1911/1915/1917 synthase
MARNEGYLYSTRVEPRDAGSSVLEFHARRFPHHDLEQWKSAIEAGRVRLNGGSARCDERVRAGDRLEYDRPAWDEPAAPLTFRVVHEDADLLVVDKPAGLQVLPAGPFTRATLLHLVRASEPSRAGCSPIHRLGRGTSGLILFGKHAAARAHLARQFQDRRARKTYLALVQGTDLPASLRAEQPIGRCSHGPLRIACVLPGGQAALTRIRVLTRQASLARSLVAAQPITGRADQIRIHLAAAGAPILGDPLYGPGGLPKSDCTPGEGGYFLHATALAIVHPRSERRLALRSFPEWLT